MCGKENLQLLSELLGAGAETGVRWRKSHLTRAADDWFGRKCFSVCQVTWLCWLPMALLRRLDEKRLQGAESVWNILNCLQYPWTYVELLTKLWGFGGDFFFFFFLIQSCFSLCFILSVNSLEDLLVTSYWRQSLAMGRVAWLGAGCASAGRKSSFLCFLLIFAFAVYSIQSPLLSCFQHP